MKKNSNQVITWRKILIGLSQWLKRLILFNLSMVSKDCLQTDKFGLFQQVMIKPNIIVCKGRKYEYFSNYDPVIECVGWRRHSSLIFLILLSSRPNTKVSGWLYQISDQNTYQSLEHSQDQPIKFFDSLNWRLRVTVSSCEIFFYFIKGVLCGEPSKLVVLDDLICRRFSEFESGAAGAKVLSSTGHWNGRQKTDGKVTTMN